MPEIEVREVGVHYSLERDVTYVDIRIEIDGINSKEYDYVKKIIDTVKNDGNLHNSLFVALAKYKLTQGGKNAK